MRTIKSFEALKKHRTELKQQQRSREKGTAREGPVIVKVATATCSNAAGATEILEFMEEELEKRGIHAIVTKTGCMGYCYAEPTVEVTRPDNDPVIFGNVDQPKADEIIESYIKAGKEVDGVVPVSYVKIEDIK